MIPVWGTFHTRELHAALKHKPSLNLRWRKSQLIQHHTEVKIEQNLENDGRVKKALAALMKSRGGGDTPRRKTPRKRG